MNRDARDKRKAKVEKGLEPPEPPEVTCKGYGPPPEDEEASSREEDRARSKGTELE